MWFSRIGGGGLDWRVLAAIALLFSVGARYFCGASWERTAILFFNVEGTAFLASSISPSRMTLERGWRRWFDRGFSGPTAFVPFLFWLGLTMLAVAAFLSAVID